MTDTLRAALDALAKLEAAATPGPWRRTQGSVLSHIKTMGGDYVVEGTKGQGVRMRCDADLIAAMRNLAPRLLAEVPALLNERDALKERLGALVEAAEGAYLMMSTKNSGALQDAIARAKAGHG